MNFNCKKRNPEVDSSTKAKVCHIKCPEAEPVDFCHLDPSVATVSRIQGPGRVGVPISPSKVPGNKDAQYVGVSTVEVHQHIP
jgi:hypothetical protein